MLAWNICTFCSVKMRVFQMSIIIVPRSRVRWRHNKCSEWRMFSRDFVIVCDDVHSIPLLWICKQFAMLRLMNALNINSYHSPTKFLQPANLTTYTILSLFSLQVELAPRLLSPELDHLYLPHYKSPTALSHMHHLTCGISSLLHSVNFILFTVLVHLILHISYFRSIP